MRLAALILTLLLTGCATTYQCERKAMQAQYTNDAMENILIHDTAMRECRGEKR